MTNYDLEESDLIIFQIILSCAIIFTTIISITLSYDYLLKINKKEALYSEEEAANILIFNRFIMFLVALLFIYINVKDKEVKRKYNSDDKFSNLQILASIFSLTSSLIVLYVGVISGNNITSEENPNI